MSTALARRQIENQATGASSSMLNISQSVIRGLVIALPTVAEQSSILSRINEGLSKLRALSDEAARAIEILRERRSALISAAVTGKIDVRGLVEAPQEQQALESA
jgi:type I restriction enzyme S subunit